MNRILLISLAIVFCVSSIHCDEHQAVKEANGYRRQTAKDMEIANMNELETSQELQEILRKLPDPCNPPSKTKDGKYELVFLPDIDATGLDFITGNALSTELAVLEVSKQCGDNARLAIMDVPSGSSKMGEPGSACEAGRINKDGLCVKGGGGGTGGKGKNPVMSRNGPSGGGGGQNGPLETTTSSISATSVLMSIFTVIFAFFVN